MMSLRGSRPKIASESWTEPASLPSRVVTFNSIYAPSCSAGGFRGLLAAGNLELAGLRSFLRQRLLHGIAHRDPAALGAGNGAFDQDQAALDVGLDDAKVERGDAIDTHVAGHLLVLPGLAGVLTAAGRTDRTVRDRHAVSGAQTAEVPALHAAGKTLTDRGAGDVDELADDEVVGLDLGADRDQRVLGDAEFRDLAASARPWRPRTGRAPPSAYTRSCGCPNRAAARRSRSSRSCDGPPPGNCRASARSRGYVRRPL